MRTYLRHQQSTVNKKSSKKEKREIKKKKNEREKQEIKIKDGEAFLPGTHVVVAPHVIVAAVLVNVFMRQATQLEEPLDDLYKPIPQPEHGPPLAPV